MHNRETRYFNALATLHVGDYGALQNAYTTHGTWEQAWIAATGALPPYDPDALYTKLEEHMIELIMNDDPRFPAALREIPCPPFALYIRGTLPQSWDTALGIVGTRKATPDGLSIAERWSHTLAARGCTIISGLALGIDAAAHRGCLDAGGTTIAVLAHGLDVIYPPTNTNLGLSIIEHNGCLISEYPINSPSFPSRFLERNRIVSGLSRGVLIIEAPTKSGSLATARFALDQNKDIFVVPGPIKSRNYEGSHDLIRMGATLVADPDHILEAWNIPTASIDKNKKTDDGGSTPEEKKILGALRHAGRILSLEEITQTTELDVPTAQQTITRLILSELIHEYPNGYSI